MSFDGGGSGGSGSLSGGSRARFASGSDSEGGPVPSVGPQEDGRRRSRSRSRKRNGIGNANGEDFDSADGSTRGGGGGAPKAGFKRLIVCCDGTWLDIDASLTTRTLPPPSNITRLSRAILAQSTPSPSLPSIPQIIYYQAGVGSMATGNQYVGGITGMGLAEHVREAYTFIASNWEPGDEIFLLGFSRGAFTARSVAGLIADIGVLTRKGLPSFPVVYKDFAHRYSRSYRTPDRDVPFPNKPSFRDPEYANEMQRRGLTTLGVRIRAVAVFDTVGSLGIPRIAWLGRFSQQLSAELSDYRFYDTRLAPCIDNAFQALALDERRAAFGPAVWEKVDGSKTKLVQVWFPGVHSNIGGGYDDQELANITLAWMVSMLEPLLEINPNYVVEQDDLNVAYYRDNRKRVRPWSFGKILNSETGKYLIGGGITRTPGDYYRIDPRTGATTRKPLRNTNEYIHASVRARLVQGGPGIEDRGAYVPRALRDWRVRYEDVEGLPSPWFWELQDPDPREEAATILPEAPLRDVEIGLLRLSPRMEKYVLSPPPPPQPRPPPGREDGDGRRRRPRR